MAYLFPSRAALDEGKSFEVTRAVHDDWQKQDAKHIEAVYEAAAAVLNKLPENLYASDSEAWVTVESEDGYLRAECCRCGTLTSDRCFLLCSIATRLTATSRPMCGRCLTAKTQRVALRQNVYNSSAAQPLGRSLSPAWDMPQHKQHFLAVLQTCLYMARRERRPWLVFAAGTAWFFDLFGHDQGGCKMNCSFCGEESRLVDYGYSDLTRVYGPRVCKDCARNKAFSFVPCP